MTSAIDHSLSKAAEGKRLSFDEGVALFDCKDLTRLGRAADAVTRRLHPEPYRTYNIDRNINYTNVCAAVCDFCAFYRKSTDADAYVLPREVLYKKIEETVALGGDQILLQGGNHPSLKLEWYEELLRDPMEVRREELVDMVHEEAIREIPIDMLVQPVTIGIGECDEDTQNADGGQRFHSL